METIEILIIAGIVFIIQMLFFPKTDIESNILKEQLSLLKEEISKIQTNLGKIDTYLKSNSIKSNATVQQNKNNEIENVQSHVNEFYNSLSELISKTELRLRKMINGIFTEEFTGELSLLKENISKIQTSLVKFDIYNQNKIIEIENTQSHKEFYDSLSELVSKTELRLKNMISGIKYVNRANALNIYTLEDFENEQSNQQENIISQ